MISHEHQAMEAGEIAHALTLLEDIALMLDRQMSRDAEVTKVPATTEPSHLLESNRFRHLAVIYNDSAATMYLKLGSGAGADDWTAKLLQDDYFECPAGYTGPVSAAWASATGQARVTELA